MARHLVLNPYRFTQASPELSGAEHLAASIFDGNRRRMELEDAAAREDKAAAIAADERSYRRGRDAQGDTLAADERAYRRKRDDIGDATTSAHELERQAEHEQARTDAAGVRSDAKEHQQNRDAIDALKVYYAGTKGKGVDPGDHSLKVYKMAMDIAHQQHGPKASPYDRKATADAIYDRLRKVEGSDLIDREPDGPDHVDEAPPAPPAGIPAQHSTGWLDMHRSGAPGVHTVGDVTGGRWFGHGDFPPQDDGSGDLLGGSDAMAPAAAPTNGGKAYRTSNMRAMVESGQYPDIESAIAHAESLGYNVIQDE